MNQYKRNRRYNEKARKKHAKETNQKYIPMTDEEWKSSWQYQNPLPVGVSQNLKWQYAKLASNKTFKKVLAICGTLLLAVITQAILKLLGLL